jgi:hypothetical protein
MPSSQPAADVAEFGTALSQLLHAAGLNPPAVLRKLRDNGRDRYGPSRPTLYSWTKGPSLPGSGGPLLEVVLVCLAEVKKRQVDIGSLPGTEEGWLQLLDAAVQARDLRVLGGLSCPAFSGQGICG